MNKGLSDVSRCTLALRNTSELYEDLASNTAQRMLADVEKLAPDISSRAAEIEALRQIPPDLIEALRVIGVFRMFVPRSRGGMELDLASALEIISALSSIDGSVGWNAMIGSGGGIFAPLLPREIYDRLYETGPDTIVAGSSQPAGTAEKEGDQWCVTGRWPFASGCMHAAWIMALCTMKDGGKHLLDGRWYPNRPRVFLAGAQLGDRRHLACLGLRGTGSHHIKVTNAMVPAEHFFDSNGAFHASLDRSTKQCVKSFHFYMPLSISVWPKVH